ncbi:MAG: aspartate aminotransferase family protein [Halobacteriovoraceae bacterium]|jgi:sphinganine-1-phosphate aldolase|nr:aspartate aminotransferase family protein [Halobacteriovoraceae bacterium]MBT5094570.1 aspartate aminotransferase family protein [Halobacteriovoraceae bacterium]
MTTKHLSWPIHGDKPENILKKLEEKKKSDIDWEGGKVFSLVFKTDKELGDLSKAAYNMYFSENALNPSAFPSLKEMEKDVVTMMTELLGGNENSSGSFTSGGTESILMAVKTAREWAKTNHPEITEPEMIIPLTAHPAFNKAAHYFGIKLITIDTDQSYRADLTQLSDKISSRTILIVGSAPSYPQGVIDPIESMAKIAKEKNILFHVDACIGGVLLPFLKLDGVVSENFDFSVPGVTSISADLHKYGYTPKGSSVVLYKDKSLKRFQFFTTTNWPGGMYGSPTVTGTRPGGAIAGSWAVMQYLGFEGYQNLARKIFKVTQSYADKIDQFEGISYAMRPESSIICLTSQKFNIYQIGDEMQKRGWHLDRQQNPSSLHMTVMKAHEFVQDEFFEDLKLSLEVVKSFDKKMQGLKTSMTRGMIKAMPSGMVSSLIKGKGKKMGESNQDEPNTAAMYGMMGAIKKQSDLDSLILDVMEQLF